jgi:hypothetical protein
MHLSVFLHMTHRCHWHEGGEDWAAPTGPSDGVLSVTPALCNKSRRTTCTNCSEGCTTVSGGAGADVVCYMERAIGVSDWVASAHGIMLLRRSETTEDLAKG